MPRLKQDIERDLRYSVIASWAARHGYNRDDIARALLISTGSASGLKKHPERMRIETVERMKLDKDELYQLVYGRKA